MNKILKLIILLNIFICANLFASKNLYLSYSKVPTNVYKNQKFEVTVRALVTTNSFDELTTTFSNSSNITIVNPKNPWTKISDDTYENSYYFKLKEVDEQGISNLKDAGDKQNLVYYFVTPIHKKKMVITYYNTNTKSLKDITVPLMLQNELVSTQTDLNPNDSSFEKYKKVASAFAFIGFTILFILKRKKIFLIISLIFLAISIIYFLPNSVGTVKKDAFVYILPTKNSTIFFKLQNDQSVEILDKKNGFIKVLILDSNFIGWIKEENLGTN